MRTTLDLDDRILAVARAVARDEGISLGAAVSALARRGFEAAGRPEVRSGFPVFEPAVGAAAITLDKVNETRDAD